MAYRKITVENKTYIAPLQMYGPILNPISVPDSVVISLVRKGYTVNQKLKNGTTIRLTIYNVKDPEATVEPTSTSTKPQLAHAPVKKAVEMPKSPVEKMLKERTEMASKPDVIDDGERDFGAPVGGINTTPVIEPEISKAVVQVAITPEERGLRIVEKEPEEPKPIVFAQPEPAVAEPEEEPEDVTVEEETEEEPIVLVVSAEEDSESEETEETESTDTEEAIESTTNTQQPRKNKKKKRR